MIPVHQTAFGARGNCMAACWASILEIPIEAVPDYQGIAAAGGLWMNAVNTWLSKHFRRLYIETERYVTRTVQPLGWHLINGDTPREGNGGHSVVGFCGRVVWDPNPRGVGIRRLDTYGLLVPLTTELRQTWERMWPTCQCPFCMRGGHG